MTLTRLRRFRWFVRRAWARVWQTINPIALLQNWSYDGYEFEEPRMTWRAIGANAALWKLTVWVTMLRLIFCRTDEDIGSFPFWQRLLYRGKAFVCLFFGWHSNGDTQFERTGFTRLFGYKILSWNGRTEGYYEPEYDEDYLEVAEGWRNWCVELVSRQFYGDGP